MISVPIAIDGRDLMNQFNITANQVESICDGIAKQLAAKYAEELEEQAKQHLHQTRSRYVRNIRLVDSGRMEGTVLLDYSKDKLIKMLEEGASPFDMKEKMLSGPNAKTSKKGVRYNTIPFRWGTPGAVAEADVFSGKMSKEAYNVVRKMPATMPIAGGGKRSEGISSEDAVAIQEAGKREAIFDSQGKVLFEEYQHKASVYAGLHKIEDPTTGQNKYMSFRVVSDNSDNEAFVHPGIEAFKLMEKAFSNFNTQQEMSIALDRELINLGF